MTDYKKMAADAWYVPNKGTVCDHYSREEDARTRQSERDSADINLTLKKYNLQPSDFTRLQAGWSGRQIGEFGDATNIPSYAEMLDRFHRARDAFMEFPPEVRAFFGNNPAAMLDAWDHGLHAEVFEELGLIVPAPDLAAKAKAEREARVSEIADGVRAANAVEKKPA